MHDRFRSCPKQGTKIERVVLYRVCILGIFRLKQGQGFKPSAAHLYPKISPVPSPPPPSGTSHLHYIYQNIKFDRLRMSFQIFHMKESNSLFSHST